MTKTGIDVFLTCVASVLHYLARHAKTEPDDVRHQLLSNVASMVECQDPEERLLEDEDLDCVRYLASTMENILLYSEEDEDF